ncbi:nucleotidyltransferase domain-containing protein [candidate division WOR-3 bacterium]|nr:nucleotidyltransferase domain-containing protein [candidate division WOR-3 bacterium]MCK4525869.1 nucleotidyltransferase domain-containing protein [candidate division WOR-3 bacterium]
MSIYEEFKSPLMDFIERAEEIPNLIGVILFGSALTGDVSKKSDIDLLLVTKSDHNPEIGDEARVARGITAAISEKYNLKHPFSLTFYNIGDKGEMEPDFLWEVRKSGIMIWGDPRLIVGKKLKEALNPNLLCTYSLKGIEEKDKRAVIRKLYKSKSKIIDVEKEKIAPGVLLMDPRKEPLLKDLFDKHGVKIYSIKKVWTH